MHRKSCIVHNYIHVLVNYLTVIRTTSEMFIILIYFLLYFFTFTSIEGERTLAIDWGILAVDWGEGIVAVTASQKHTLHKVLREFGF